MPELKNIIIFKYLLYSVVILLLAGSNAFAHILWINADNHYPETGETVNIEIGWGHEYTESRTDEKVDEDLIKTITAIGPGGEVSLERISPSLYRLKVNKPGAYIIAARINTDPGMFTITPEGRKRGGKKGVKNAVRCSAYDIFAKTIVIAGGDSSNISRSAGHPLEVVLHGDPSSGRKNLIKPVVLYEGKPLSGAIVRAAYAGYDSSQGSWPVEVETNRRGQAEIRTDRDGYWVILLSHTTPYSDQEVCDDYRYTTSFTFKMKGR